MDASSYARNNVLNKWTLDFDQYHLAAYFLWNMIVAETRYEIHNSELLVIVKALKNWEQYLKSCKHEILLLTDYNYLCLFIDTESLSFLQVCLA